jgi:hypothetical protein
VCSTFEALNTVEYTQHIAPSRDLLAHTTELVTIADLQLPSVQSTYLHTACCYGLSIVAALLLRLLFATCCSGVLLVLHTLYYLGECMPSLVLNSNRSSVMYLLCIRASLFFTSSPMSSTTNGNTAPASRACVGLHEQVDSAKQQYISNITACRMFMLSSCFSERAHWS